MLEMNALEKNEYNRIRIDLEKWIIAGSEQQLDNLQLYMKNRMVHRNDTDLFQAVREHVYENFFHHSDNILDEYGRDSEQYERAIMLTGTLFDDRLKAAQGQAAEVIAEKTQAEISANLAEIEKLTQDLAGKKPKEQQSQPRRSFTSGFDTMKEPQPTPKGNTLDGLKAKAKELAPDVEDKKPKGHSGIIHKKQKYHDIPASDTPAIVNAHILLAIQHRIEGLEKQKSTPERKNRKEALVHFADTLLTQNLNQTIDIANVYKQAMYDAKDESKFKEGTSLDSSGHGNKSEFHNLIRHICQNDSKTLEKISQNNPPIEKESKKSRSLKGG
tara:strand:+ start:18410 stop:19396 length:987 start_codon:yes stop_codon:yes gene_type:complete